MGDGALTRRDRQLLRPGVAKRAALVPVVIGGSPRMELVDEALGEPLLDVFRVRAVTKSPRFLSDLGRGSIGRQLKVAQDEIVRHGHGLAVHHFRWLVDADVVVQALAHFLDAVEPFE